MRTAEISLTKNLVAIVDAEDLERVLASGPWHAMVKGRTAYAVHGVWRSGDVQKVLMHNLVSGWSRVDHINGNGLDNRKENLRRATTAQNAANRRRYKNNTSGFKGVHRVTRASGYRWRTVIQPQGKMVSLGVFDTPEGAARAYDEAATIHYGEFASLNFPSQQREEL